MDSRLDMPVSENAEQFLLDAWNVALDHSGFGDADFYVLSCPGRAVDGYAKAANYEPGVGLEEDDLLAGALLTEANDPEHIAKHRIAILEDIDDEDPVQVAVLTAKLRHEIEHARQRMACGGVLFAVDELAEQVLSWKAGGLPGSRVLYNLKPIEQDANAAAAMLLKDLFDAQIVAEILNSDEAVLARSLTPPGDPDSLLTRTVCFMYLFAEIAEDPARSPNGIPFDRRIDTISTEAGELWRSLQSSGSSN
jgi:hypothetical protein